MRYSLLAVIAFLLAVSSAPAQVPAEGPSPALLQRCLLDTKPETWAQLKLSPDQLRRMGFVQEACSEECEAAGVTRPAHTISNADGATVMAEVRNILTEEQYAAWVAICAPSGPGAPK